MSKDSATIRDLIEIDLVRYISKKSLNITFNQCAIIFTNYKYTAQGYIARKIK